MENALTTTEERDCYEVWENCLRVIREEIDPQAYTTWFEPILPHSLQGYHFTIQVPSKFFFEYLEEHFVDVLRRALDVALGAEYQLHYRLKPEESQYTQNNTPAPARATAPANGRANAGAAPPPTGAMGQEEFMLTYRDLYDSTRLNLNYTFDNFIEGDCNRLARSAGLAIAQKPGVNAFNPLMLYGGVGLGKTHLMQAIGHYVERYYADKKVIYVTTDKFTNQFIEALKNNNLDHFINFYERVDLLMIDDVQFLAGKERTQEIFFNIFNRLHQSGRQIVMTSDCPPIELQGLEERLLSRFKWGLSADLKQPDLETRTAIIHKKLQERHIDFPEDVIEYLTNSVDSNIRELEGAINSLILYSENGIMIDMNLARQVVQNLVQTVEKKELTIDDVQRVVSEYFTLSIEDLKDKTRKKEIVLARQIAMYFAKEHTGFSLKSIGYHFGGRDHSTVIHAIQSVSDYLEERKEIKAHIDAIKKILLKQA